LDGQVTGFQFFIGQQKAKHAHVGEVGLNVHAGHRAMGIGRTLTETLIKWASNCGMIEKIVLQVFATNHNAINLYKALAFKEEGRFIKAIKQKNGVYADVIQLYLFVGQEGQ
jgi:L-amino acid N-acyltransferase YncA